MTRASGFECTGDGHEPTGSRSAPRGCVPRYRSRDGNATDQPRQRPSVDPRARSEASGPSFEVSTQELTDGALIELRGDIDGSAREALSGAYDAASPMGTLLLDFEHVAYVNSTGIALIVDLLARARADRRSVAAQGLSEHYREIFEITRLSDFMTILVHDPPSTTERSDDR
jgi:anti-sigma B factor antagonist